MKTALFVIGLLLCYTVATAQDSHQPPSAMTFSQSSLVNHDQQSKFIYSWNWAGGPSALNSRYKMNAYHTLETFNNTWTFPSQPTLYNLMPDSLNFLWKPYQLHGDNEPLDAPAMMWYPWLPPSASDADFTSFQNDKTGASLSFLNPSMVKG
ncbi:MAG: hypothetical protein JST20_00985 [Bacteroidetes bacterium]|nr:hypothetical protein [Bacteroidota bacterium]